MGADSEWGLDHGTWSVLCHVFPEASVPVVQLSMDETQPAPFHYELGRRLQPLRDEGILVMGSGNLVHNLHAYAWGRHPTEPFDWALRFETLARELIAAGDHGPLVGYEAPRGRRAALRPHARALPAAALRAGRVAAGGRGHLPGGRDRRGIGLHAGRRPGVNRRRPRM